jgi:hypothetical protein
VPWTGAIAVAATQRTRPRRHRISQASAARDLEGGIDFGGPGEQSAFEMRRRPDVGTDGQRAVTPQHIEYILRIQSEGVRDNGNLGIEGE